MTLYWPTALLRPRRAPANPAHATLGGPVALSGFRQSLASYAGAWRVSLEAVRVVTPAQTLLWRALGALVIGRATSIVVPVFDRDGVKPVTGTPPAVVLFSDGTAFDDGTGFAASRCQVRTTEAAARGASTLTVEVVHGLALAAGMQFSIGTRLYRIAALADGDDDTLVLSVWPPLREDVVAGAECEFDNPVCKVRLSDDMGLALNLELGRHATPSVSFVEDPT